MSPSPLDSPRLQAARKYPDDHDAKSPILEEVQHVESKTPKSRHITDPPGQTSSGWVLSNLRITDAEFEFLSLFSDESADVSPRENQYPSNEQTKSTPGGSTQDIKKSEESQKDEASGIDLRGGLEHAENNWVYEHMNCLVNEIYSPVSGYALLISSRGESRDTRL